MKLIPCKVAYHHWRKCTLYRIKISPFYFKFKIDYFTGKGGYIGIFPFKRMLCTVSRKHLEFIVRKAVKRDKLMR